MPTLSVPAVSTTDASVNSPRRAVYEELLDSTPGVIRQGDGWSSWGSAAGKAMAKTTSMVSLRERALAFLHTDNREPNDHTHREAVRVSRDMTVQNKPTQANATGSARDRRIVDLAREVDGSTRRSRQGLETPITDLGPQAGRPERKGIFGKLKGMMGRKGDRTED